MKYVLIISWSIIIIAISLLINLSKTKKYVYLSLCSLILLIALNFNIKVYEKVNIYIPSVLVTLLIYNLVINKVKVDKKYKHLFICLYIIFTIYIFQLIFIKIYTYQLFVSNLSYFLVIGFLLRYFINIKEFDYSENHIFSLISAFSLCNSVLGILQFVYNKTFLIFSAKENINYESIINIKRVVGFVGANNGAGNLGAILFPVLLFTFLNKKNMHNFIILILNVLFTILTFTRIGYLAITIELIVFFTLGLNSGRLSDKIIKYYSLAMLIILLVFIYYNFSDNIYYYLIVGRGNTQQHRFIQFKFIISEFIKHPILGIGSGQYVDFNLNNYRLYDLEVHSQYLNILIEQGIISFISFIFFNVYIIKILLNKFNKNYRWLILSIFIGNLIVINFNPNQYYTLNIYLYYFIVFGLMFSNYSELGRLKQDIETSVGDSTPTEAV